MADTRPFPFPTFQPKTQKAAQAYAAKLIAAWKHPEGTEVEVLRDSGEVLRTKTRSMPWALGESSRGPGHTAVISVNGIAGGYSLDRVRVVVARG